jgi:HAD superfamily hydrolase (TIGR01490 family)
MAGKSIKIAVFDIDGTVFRSSLLIELINQLVEDGVFPKIARKEMEKDYNAWLNRVGTYENYLNEVIKIFYKNIKGKTKAKVDKAVRKVIASHKDRVYRFTRDLIKKFKKDNYFLLTVSGSPVDIVGPFADYLGFDAHCGRIFEVKDGTYSGRVLNNELMNERKDKIITQYFKKAGLKVDFKNSIAVGDTEGDITMLSLVGKPIAFNPNNNLAKVAKKKKWPVIVERKDVIFSIERYSFFKS